MSYAKVRAILDAATPGRWAPPDDLDTFADGDKCDIEAIDVDGEDGYPVVVADYLDPADARAIVVARNLAPELLTVAEAAWKAELHLSTMNRQALNPGPDHLVAVTVETWRDAVAPTVYDLHAALAALHAKMKETLP